MHASTSPPRLSSLGGMIGQFFAGVGALFQGFGYWKKKPHLMLLGLIPALIVFLLVGAALVTLLFFVDDIVAWATPWAASWDEVWRNVLRIAFMTLIVAGGVFLSVTTFTAITLAVGDPFYERIWLSVERDLGDENPGEGLGFFAAVKGSLWLVGMGILAAIAVAVIGVIPLVGSVTAAIVGVALNGTVLSRELTGRALDARRLLGDQRASVIRGNRAQLLGFGVATQLCFMVPGGAVFTMPAAVAGSTVLARRLLDERGLTGVGGREGSPELGGPTPA